MATKTIRFTLPGEAVPQQRPRFSTFGGHARAYDPPKSRDYKTLVKLAASDAMGDIPPSLESVTVGIFVYLPVPKSWGKRKTALALSGKLLPKTHGMDVDNLAKSVMDGMTGIVYKDDSQVATLYVTKEYSEKPHVQVSCEWEQEEETKNV